MEGDETPATGRAGSSRERILAKAGPPERHRAFNADRLGVSYGGSGSRLPGRSRPCQRAVRARVAFGNRLGFANAWSYWITAWAGNAAIAVGWVLYVEHFINKGHTKWITVLLVLAGLWIPAAINLSGVKNMGSVQVITTIIKFVALAFMVVAGLSLVFSILFIWYSRNTGHSFWVYWAPFFLAGGALLLGIPVHLAQRRHLTPPAPVPAYR